MSILLVVVTITSAFLMASLSRPKAAAEADVQTVAEMEVEKDIVDEFKEFMESMLTTTAEAATSAAQATEGYTATTFYPKVETFVNTPSIWKTAKALYNCHEGAELYTNFMSGTRSFTSFPSYTNPSEVLPGDVVQIKGHYLVVLDCTAASSGRINLRTFETNWPKGGYTIANGTYWVKDNQIHRNGTSQNRPFIQGWHVITSFYNAAKSCVDSAFYSGCYSDIKSAFGSDYSKMLAHFMEFGILEGRTASPSFNVVVYINKNSDIKAAFKNNYRQAFYHYCTFGIFEKNRISSDFYNGTYYLDKYSDLVKAFGARGKAYVEAATHFNSNGVQEHRQAIATFSVEKYKANYSDLAKTFNNQWLKYFIHYFQFGKSEGRTAS